MNLVNDRARREFPSSPVVRAFDRCADGHGFNYRRELISPGCSKQPNSITVYFYYMTGLCVYHFKTSLKAALIH